MPRMRVKLAAIAGVAATALLLSGCDNFLGPAPWDATPTPTNTATAALPTATCSNFGFESVFSAYGSVHYTRVLAPNLTFYLDMFTEEKTHEWYAETPAKSMSYVMRVVDTNAQERDPFKLKRKVYMSKFVLDYNYVNAAGAIANVYHVDLDPIQATLDPEALTSKKYGLLITSPKGGFQRNDKDPIPALPADAKGVNIDMQLTMSSQTALGEKNYNTQVYTIQLPVAIFSAATKDQSTSCATNATLDPVLQ